MAFGEASAAKQFDGRKGHGGNPELAERHLTKQQLKVLLAGAFEAGAALAYPELVEALRSVVRGWNAIPPDVQVPETLNNGVMDAAEAFLRDLGEEA